MNPRVRRLSLAIAALVLLTGASGLAAAHEPGVTGASEGFGFGAVVAATVAIGLLGGAIVVRMQRATGGSRPSVLVVSLLLVVLGSWATALAVSEGALPAVAFVALGGLTTWSLRNRVLGDHCACDQAALGAVLLHRFVEGSLLATVYAADAVVGVGVALVLAAHSAAETGAVAGLWSGGRRSSRWGVVVAVQAVFVAGAFGGAFAIRSLPGLASAAVLAIVGGVLIAAGVAAASSRRHPTPA